jgi:hypothetical protein
MYKSVVTLIIALFAGGAPAWAIPSSLPIDFRTTAWDLQTEPTQKTVDDITAFAAFPPGSVLTWSSTAGLGLDADGFLALSPVDILNFTFANGSGTGLTGVWVTNLPAGSLESGVLELVTTTGTDILDFVGKNSTGNDYISFGGALNVLTAEFCALDPTGQLFSQSYSVAGFTSVPDRGTTLMLLGIGLISVIALHRRLAF